MTAPPVSAWPLRVGRAALDFIFPPTCVGCGRAGHLLCPACAQTVAPVPEPRCASCGRPQPAAVERCPQCRRRAGEPLLKVRAAALHTHPLREAIHALKYDGRTGLAPLLARYLVVAYVDPLWRTLPRPIDAVTPVPLHAARLAERGYNQSSLLAAAFCAATGLPLQTGWLARSRETRPQVGLGPAERQANVDGAFVADPAVAGKVILLIDDVLTTGATLAACAAAADAQGAFAVYGLTLAQPVPRPAAHPTDVWWEGNV